MMGNMPTSTIREMCELVVDCPHFTPDWTDGGYIVIRNQNIRNGRLDLSTPSFTHETDFLRRIHRARPKEGDIVITREAPMGEVCLVPPDIECCLGQRQVLLRPKLGIDSRYLHIALQSPYVRHQILWSEGTGSTVSNIRIPVLEAIKIPRFGHSEPRIASVIGALNDKIELNRRMNETLEASARALYRDWFVDFGPTRAKAEGRPAYLAPDIWSLFPDRLADNSVPDNWNTYALGDLVHQHTATINPGASSEEIFEHYSLPAFDVSGSPALDKGDSIKSNKTLVPPGAVLLSKLNPEISRVWVPNGSGKMRQIASTEFLAFVPKAPASDTLLFALFRDEAFRQTMEGMVTGTSKSHQRISPPALRAMKALVGSSTLFEAFERTVAPMMKVMLQNRTESHTLAATRDALLPKLMSGEIRVRDAEALAA